MDSVVAPSSSLLDREKSFRTGAHRAGETSAHFHRRHFGSGDHRARRVSDCADELTQALRLKTHSNGERQSRREKGRCLHEHLKEGPAYRTTGSHHWEIISNGFSGNAEKFRSVTQPCPRGSLRPEAFLF